MAHPARIELMTAAQEEAANQPQAETPRVAPLTSKDLITLFVRAALNRPQT
jgi:hypothetical protein